jgi:hypothetical protein
VTITRSGHVAFLNTNVHRHGNVDFSLGESLEGFFDRPNGVCNAKIGGDGLIIKKARGGKA